MPESASEGKFHEFEPLLGDTKLAASESVTIFSMAAEAVVVAAEAAPAVYF